MSRAKVIKAEALAQGAPCPDGKKCVGVQCLTCRYFVGMIRPFMVLCDRHAGRQAGRQVGRQAGRDRQRQAETGRQAAQTRATDDSVLK